MNTVATEAGTYRYYLVYYYGKPQVVGAEFIVRETPLDNEQALLEELERLEGVFGRPVVLDDWKRMG